MLKRPVHVTLALRLYVLIGLLVGLALWVWVSYERRIAAIDAQLRP